MAQESVWSFKDRAVSDWGYVFFEKPFTSEGDARAYFEQARARAGRNGGAGSLHCGASEVARFSIWCPND